MDFSKIKIIQKANPRKPEVVKEKVVKPTFHLKVNYDKQKLIFSPALAEQIQLEHNSLAQGTGPEGELLLLVMPGNTGVFAKTGQKGAKGRSFKNLNFVTELLKKGLTGGKFNLEFLGENEGILYHQVIPFVSAEVEPEEEDDEEDLAAEGAEAPAEDKIEFN